jgi:hypothetical protein
MRLNLSRLGNWMRREVPPGRLVLLVLVSAIGFVGAHLFPGHSPTSARSAIPKPEQPAAAPCATLDSLRPRAGDHMTLPRVGFRWSFNPTPGSSPTISKASMIPSFLSGTDSVSTRPRLDISPRFILHLLGPGGHPEITKETSATEVRLNLTKGFSPGDCEWWVEALIPGAQSITSARERFALSQ